MNEKLKEKIAVITRGSSGIVKILSLLCLTLIAVTVKAQNQSAIEPIRKARATSNEALAKGDLTAYAATITSDFVITAGNGGSSTHDAFLATLAKSFSDATGPRCVRTPEQITLSTSRPLAAERGHWECCSLRPDGTLVATGTYMAMWRNDAGTWRTRSELFVTLACTGSRECAPSKP
jgi:ketosteroid isomerase-like protein